MFMARLGGHTMTSAIIHCWSNTAETVSFTANGVYYEDDIDPLVDNGTLVFNITGLTAGQSLGQIDVDFSVQGTDDVYPYALKSGAIKTAWVSCINGYTLGVALNAVAEDAPDNVMFIGDEIYGDNWNGTDYLGMGFSPINTQSVTADYVTPGYTEANFVEGYCMSFFRPYFRKMLKHVHTFFSADDHETGIGDCRWAPTQFNTDSNGGALAYNMVDPVAGPTQDAQIEAFRIISRKAFWDMCSSSNGFGTIDAMWGYVDSSYSRLLVVDCMWHKTPHTTNTQTDSYMFGSTQVQWLKDSLSSAPQPNKLIFSSKKIFPSQVDSADGGNSYQWERNLGPGGYIPWISDNVKGVSWYSGDRHNPSWYSARVSDGDDFDHASFNSSSLDKADHELGYGFAPYEKWKIAGWATNRVALVSKDPTYWEMQRWGKVESLSSKHTVSFLDQAQNLTTQTVDVLSGNNFAGENSMTTTIVGQPWDASETTDFNIPNNKYFPFGLRDGGAYTDLAFTTESSGVSTLGAWTWRAKADQANVEGWITVYENNAGVLGDLVAYSPNQAVPNDDTFATYNIAAEDWVYTKETGRLPNDVTLTACLNAYGNIVRTISQTAFVANVNSRFAMASPPTPDDPASEPPESTTVGWYPLIGGELVHIASGGSGSTRSVIEDPTTKSGVFIQ